MAIRPLNHKERMRAMLPRMWSKKIIKVLENYSTKSHCRLFGATGDLDNLGLFVASHGRAKAENLVDACNHIVGAAVLDFVNDEKEGIESFCLIPSGEEVFMLGCANDHASIEAFYGLLQHDINPRIRDYSPFKDSDVTISFGVCSFEDDAYRGKARELCDLVLRRRVRKANEAYFRFMERMRSDLALALDRKKFHDILPNGDTNAAVLFRNTVFVCMEQYKKTTRSTLRALALRVSDDGGGRIFDRLPKGLSYGLADGNREIIESILDFVGEDKKTAK